MELRPRQFVVRICAILAATPLLIAAAFGVLVAGQSQTATAAQSVPYLINFQGRLTDNSGNALPDGQYNVKFRIFDAASLGTNRWEGDRVFGASDNRITVANGLFNIQFGDTSKGDPALSPALFNNQTYPQLYLEVELPTPATATCASNGCAAWTEGAMTPRQPLASSPYAFNADRIDGIDGADLVVLNPGAQQTGAINVSGPIASGGTISTTGAIQASTATFQGAGALTLGSTTNAGSIIFSDGTANARSITLTAPALPAASYSLTLPAAAPSGTGQCLSTSSATQLTFTSCNSLVSLQNAYDNSSTPAAISLGTTAKDFTITATDQATDPNVLINLACVTSCGSNGRFAIQRAGTDVLAVAPTGAVTVTAPAATTGATAVAALTVTGGAGGSATSGSAGDGSAISLTTGTGGSATVTGDAGHGGDLAFTAGNGGTVTGTGTAGNGGNITLTAGAAGGATGSNGSVIVRPAGNSSTSFQLQNASQEAALTHNAIANTITVGNATGTNTDTTLLVIDQATDDPATGHNGAMYYNTTSGKFRCYQGNAWTDCITTGLLAVTNSIASFVSGVANAPATTTGLAVESLVWTSATGVSNTAGVTGFTAPANGSFRACLTKNNAAITAGTLNLRWRVNGVSVGSPACAMNATTNRQSATALDTNVVNFSAGDTIGIAFDTSGLAPTTADFTVHWSVEYYSSTGNGITLQFAYNNSASPATITTTDAKNLVINAADTTTDASILYDLQCVTCSSGGGRFAVQNAGVDVFTINPNNAGIAINDDVSVSAGHDVTIASGQSYNVGSSTGATTTCSGGQVLQNQVVTGGITTGGTCVTVSASGANTTLSNLTSPTAINQDLLSATTNTYDLGSATNIWQNLYVANIDAQSATNTTLTVGTAATTTAITIGRAGLAVSLPGGLTTSGGGINTGSGAITTSGNITTTGSGAISTAGGNISAGSGTVTAATINATTGFSANGSAGQAVTCGAGQANLGAAYSEGILITGGTCTSVQAAGSYLVQAPTGTTNTVTAASGAQALIIRGTNGTSTHLLDIYNTAASPVLTSYFDQNGAFTTTAAITAPTTTNTINGLIISSGSLTGVGANITGSGALTLSSGSTSDLTLNSLSGNLILGSNTTTIQKANTALSIDLATAATSTLTITNSNGSNVANLSVEGSITTGTGLTIGSGQAITVGSTAGASRTCSGGQVLQDQVVTGGVTTGGTCATVVGGSGANTTLSNLGTTSINADLLPSANNTRSIGSAALVWQNLYTASLDAGTTTTTLTVGTAATTTAITIGRSGVAVSLPGGLTTSGGSINAGSGNITTSGNISTTGSGTVTSAGAITAPTATNTINGLVINSGSLTNVGTNITGAGAVTLASTTNALTLTSGSGTIALGSNTVQRAASTLTLDVANAGASTLQVLNSNGSNVANLTVDGGITSGAGLTIASGQAITVGATAGQSSTVSCGAGQAVTAATFTGGVLTTAPTCSAITSSTDLNTAYTNSATPATITLTDAKNIVITAADTATDPNILMNLACATCSANGGRFAIQDNGTDVFTINPTGGVVVAPTAGQNLSLNLAAGSGFNVAAAAAPTVDQVSISNTGQAVTTANVNGLQITYIGGAGAIESSAQRMNVTPGTTSGSTWNGLRLVAGGESGTGGAFNGLKLEGPATATGGTDTAINITTGWDVGLNVQSGGMQLTGMTSDPATPASGTMRVYARQVVGRTMLKTAGSSGIHHTLQPSLFQQNIWMAQPGSANNTAQWQSQGAPGTYTTIPTFTTAGTQTQGYMANFATSNTANAGNGFMQSTSSYYRGNTDNGNNGFFTMSRVSFPGTLANYTSTTLGSRFWTGMTSATAIATMGASDAPTGDFAGFRLSGSASETTFRFLTRNNATTTNQDTGVTLQVGVTYDMYIYCKPYDSANPTQNNTIYWRIDDLTNGTAPVEGSQTATLPTVSTAMRYMTTLNTINAAAKSLRIQRMYVETDR